MRGTCSAPVLFLGVFVHYLGESLAAIYGPATRGAVRGDVLDQCECGTATVRLEL
jgi:hypothetical protein